MLCCTLVLATHCAPLRRAWRQVCRALVTANRPNRTGFRSSRKIDIGPARRCALPMNCAGNQIVGQRGRGGNFPSLRCTAFKQRNKVVVPTLPDWERGRTDLGQRCLLRPICAGSIAKRRHRHAAAPAVAAAALSPHEIDLVEGACRSAEEIAGRRRAVRRGRSSAPCQPAGVGLGVPAARPVRWTAPDLRICASGRPVRSHAAAPRRSRRPPQWY